MNYLTRHNLRKLWDEGTKVALKLTRTWTTTTGVEVLTYVPA